jgi:hypothetical protein
VLPLLPLLLLLSVLTCVLQAVHEQGALWQQQEQAGPGPAAVGGQHILARTQHLSEYAARAVQQQQGGWSMLAAALQSSMRQGTWATTTCNSGVVAAVCWQ